MNETTLQLDKIIRTKRLVLRVMDESDFIAWAEFHKNLNRGQTPTKKDFTQALRREARQAREDVRWELKIFDKKTSRMIGFIDVKTVNRDPYQVCDVGYVIVESSRGHRYAAEAVRAAIPLIFRALKFHRLEFAIEPENKASLRVARQLRLHSEGVRKHYWPTNYPKPSKIWADQIIFVITPELLKT